MNASQIAFIGYIIIAVYAGWKVKSHEASDFWTASKELNGFSLGLSISAGFMSVSWSCVYATQLFYWYGTGALWLITIPWIITLMAIFYLSRRFHQMEGFSQPELAFTRYGLTGKRITAIALVFVFLVWGGAELFIAASLLSPALKLSVPSLILIIGIVIAIYSVSGGFRAVILTDKIQYTLVAMYILVISFLGWKGFQEVSFVSPSPYTLKSHTPFFSFFSPGPGLIFLTLIAYLPGWIFESDIWLRVQAARNASEARKGLLVSLGNAILFVGILPLLIAYFALHLYPPVNNQFPPELGFEASGIFTRIATDFAPAVLIPVITLGLIAASMSTIDTCANVVALSFGYDLLPEKLKKKRKYPVLFNQIITLFAVFLTILFALHTESLWNLFYLSSGILTTTIALPMLGLLLPQLPAKPFIHGSIAGFTSTFIFYYLEKWQPFLSLEPKWLKESEVGYILFSIIAVGIVFFVSWIFHKKKNSPVQ
jgi:SSS family solute:Na+ symporter